MSKKKQNALFHFHNNGHVNAPQGYNIHTLPILFAMTTTLSNRLDDYGIVVFVYTICNRSGTQPPSNSMGTRGSFLRDKGAAV
jgi:hypothetical protein